MRKYWLGLFSALFLLAGIGSVTAEQVRVYLMTGQGGVLTSFCLANYANQLKRDPRLNVSLHLWRRYAEVVQGIRQLPLGTPIVVIGYSLGANATTWVANNIGLRVIDLIVAYDPSVLSTTYPVGLNVHRVILYHNTSLDPWGHARIPGMGQVETVETRMPHLAVDCSKKLHAITTQAIGRVH